MFLLVQFLLLLSSQFISAQKYELRQLEPMMKDKLASTWGLGIGGPYEYNRYFWRGSPGVGYGYGPNVWQNMFILGNQLKYTYGKDSPRPYSGPLTNGHIRRRAEKYREMMRGKDIQSGKYSHDQNKFGYSKWDEYSIIERQRIMRGDTHILYES